MNYRLNQCVWEITLACCFSCKYCGSRAGKARENELSVEEALSVADELKDLGCRRVSLIGGEVFLKRGWQDIVSRLTGNGINVNIITNGFLFTDEIINDLKNSNIESVSLSLDGPRDIHDKYRQAGSYDRIMTALKVLTDNNIPTSIITTLNGENVKYLKDMLTVISDYPIYAWQLQACSPMGNAAKSGIDFRFDFNEVIGFVERYSLTAPFAIGIADNIGYFTKSEGRLRGNLSGKSYFRGCNAGLSAIGIDSVGNVRGCESLYDENFNEGNLRERSLRSIWEDPDAFAYNRKFTKELLTGKCATCEVGEYCGGGCRSYNHFVHGKLYESPFCARNIGLTADIGDEPGRAPERIGSETHVELSVLENPIDLRGIIDKHGLSGWAPVNIRLAGDGNVYILLNRKVPERIDGMFVNTVSDSEFSVLVIAIDDATGQMIRDERFDLGILKMNYHFIYPWHDDFLFVGSRCLNDSKKGPEQNAAVIDRSGNLIREFCLGDGINDIIVNGDKIIVSYFDEGIFGNYGWDEPIGSAGLVVFNENAEKIWESEDPIYDCYAINLDDDGNLWYYYYDEFDLVKTDFKTVTHYATDISGADRFGIFAGGSKVMINGGYDHENEYMVAGLKDGVLTSTEKIDFSCNGEPVSVGLMKFAGSRALITDANGKLYIKKLG